MLLKADGMPTYHLANVVDDYLMKISHVVRGEEWLSSTGHHVLLYESFGWLNDIPKFAHLPLILKPSGKGKLSKRDGAKFGFPVFPLNWHDEKDDELFVGFRDEGFLPEAVLNFLAFLGWNPGTEQEIFNLSELESDFDSQKITKSGAKFNYEKALWYNQQYIIASDPANLASLVSTYIKSTQDKEFDHDVLVSICQLMKERVETINQFWSDARYLFEDYIEYDEKTARKKFKSENEVHFSNLLEKLDNVSDWNSEIISDEVKGYISQNELSFGAIFPILRISLSGSTKGPDLFDMMALLGKSKTVERIQKGIEYCQSL